MDGSMLLRGASLKLDRTIRVWGIDLGTTHSTVTEVRFDPEAGALHPPECRVLELDQPTQEGVFTSPLVPSVVAVLPSGEAWVGEGAKRLRARPQEAGQRSRRRSARAFPRLHLRKPGRGARHSDRLAVVGKEPWSVQPFG